jgi:hypothetical protein
MPTITLRQRIALHEASHAAVAFEVGEHIEEITVGPTSGEILFGPPPEWRRMGEQATRPRYPAQ